MINCTFEDGGKGSLRHATLDCVLEKDNKILLIKRAAHLFEGGKWGLPGGYLDRDETMKVGAAREVVEETGYKVSNLEYFLINSNPARPREDRQNINFTFIGEIGEKIGEPDNETDDVQWYGVDALPKEENLAFDHHMILSKYLEYRKEKFQLPILI
jgi:ADP-ribose pyrophosphatase YjhB (NUDIX family)